MKYALTLFALTLAATICVAQHPTNYITRIDSMCNQVLKDQYIAGFAVAIVKGNQVIYSKGFGYRDIANKKPVTPNTLFAIGSCSKAFTAGLLGQLQNEGKLSIDNKATSYLPQLQFYTEEMNSNITVRDMMSHRTGVPRNDFAWYVFNTSNRDSLIGRVKHMEPQAPIRQEFIYNNFMFLAQGMIAEKLTGKTWEQNIKERFFDPLGMTRSTTSIAQMKADSNASFPYKLVSDTIIKKVSYYNINGMGPAGSINSSVNDMANWLKVWINSGKYSGKQILPQWYVNTASSTQIAMGDGRPGMFKDMYFDTYGLGWCLASYRGHYRVEHGGAIDGFRSSVAFFPADSLGVVVLTNQNESVVQNLLVQSISELMLDIPPIDWITDARKKTTERVKASRAASDLDAMETSATGKPLHQQADYLGTFSNPGYGEVAVYTKKDSLFARAGDLEVWLKHRHYDVFKAVDLNNRFVDDDDTQFNFVTGTNGRVEAVYLSFDNNTKPILFTYQPKEVNLDKQELEKYAGKYGEAAFVAQVFIKDAKLRMAVEGQGEFELIAIGNHTFAIKNMGRYFVKFDVTKRNSAPAFTMIQPERSLKLVRKK